jgi:hypothetical protein
MRTERNTALCSVLDDGQLDASHTPPTVLDGAEMNRGATNEGTKAMLRYNRTPTSNWHPPFGLCVLMSFVHLTSPVTYDVCVHYPDEHLARIRAEADAQDKAQRLRVAQEQLAEYAEQKEQDASAIASQAESLEAVIQRLILQNDGSDLAAAVADNLAQLKTKLMDAAAEAKAFAAQQRDDVERAKRSHQQVGA